MPFWSGAPMNSPAALKTRPKRPSWQRLRMRLALKRLAFDAQWVRSGIGGPGRIEGDQLGVGVGPTPTEGNVVPPEPG